IIIKEGDRYKTAFITQDGLFHFKYMPFGMNKAPAIFQRTMDKVLSRIKWNKVVNYFDDSVVIGPTFEIFLENLDIVLTRFGEANLTIKPSKCYFAVQSIKFLGHVVDSEGIRMDPDKVEAVKNYPRPQTIRNVREFSGFTGFYRDFLPNYASIMQPLYKLTKKNAK
ncbi:hypothetical protein B4U80_08953, partial [Leptotrombidium deliense]